jgi:hypothetical protein
MKTVAEVIGVSRSNLIERMRERPKKRIGRPPPPDEKLVSEIKAVIVELPTYGYRRVHAILKRQALAAGLKPSNHKQFLVSSGGQFCMSPDSEFKPPIGSPPLRVTRGRPRCTQRRAWNAAASRAVRAFYATGLTLAHRLQD